MCWLCAPAGHTSWSTSGLGYLSLWLAGKLRAFDGSGGRPWRLIASTVPTALAVYIGLTRIEVRRQQGHDAMRQHVKCAVMPHTVLFSVPPVGPNKATHIEVRIAVRHAIQCSRGNSHLRCSLLHGGLHKEGRSAESMSFCVLPPPAAVR